MGDWLTDFLSPTGGEPVGKPGNPLGTPTSEQQPGSYNASELAKIGPDNFIEHLKGLASNGNSAATEKLLNYYLDLDAEKRANAWTSQREDTYYQRLVSDMKKAGISPYALSSGSPGVSGSVSKSSTGSEMTSRANNLRTSDANALRSMLSLLGIILSAVAFAA